MEEFVDGNLSRSLCRLKIWAGYSFGIAPSAKFKVRKVRLVDLVKVTLIRNFPCRRRLTFSQEDCPVMGPDKLELIHLLEFKAFLEQGLFP